jgi:hypothetical protein
MKRFIKILSILFCIVFIAAIRGDKRLNPPNLPNLFYRYGDTIGSGLGGSLTGVGDQNDDGYDDVLVSARGDKKALLYLGGKMMDTNPALVFHRSEPYFAHYVTNIGDINNDGKTDFAISSIGVATYLYLGGRMDTNIYLTLPTGRVAGVGDVNRDGYDDVLLSDESWSNYTGKAWLYFGGNPMDTFPDWSVQGDGARFWFGYSITGNGDLNKDGYSDFAIAGFRALESGTPAYVKIFLGSRKVDTIPQLTIDARDTPKIGRSIWFVNDLNGDGYDEFALEGGADTALYVFFGRDKLRTVPDLLLRGTGSYIADRITSVGDVNGDGYNDIITGNTAAWGGLGEVLLYLGHPGMNGEFDVGWTGFTGEWIGAGQAVAWCGDVNGDSLNDIMFSSYDPNFATRNGRVDIFGGDTSLIVRVNDNNLHDILPNNFQLHQNYPNPFNPSTTISYSLPNTEWISIKMYDMLGKEVMSLYEGRQTAGNYSLILDATDISTGVYFIRMSAGRFAQTTKLIYAK